MEITIAQFEQGDAVAYLKTLQEKLPPALSKRLETGELAAVDSCGLPRHIALIDDAEEADFDVLDAIVCDLGDPGFKVTFGLLVEPEPPVTEEMPDTAPGVPTDLAWMMQDTAPAPLATGVQDVIDQVMNSKPSGIAFPELAYEGHEKTAYNDIVAKLGVAPMDDQGETLTAAKINAIPIPKRPSPKKTAYINVKAHLVEEVTFFKSAAAWFSDNGHLRNMYRDERVFDHNFLDNINKKFELVPKTDTKAVFYVDVAMKLLSQAAGKMGPEGKAVATMMGFLWNHTKSQMGDPDGKISAKIKDLNIAVDNAFVDAVIRMESVYFDLCADWGNLEAFGRMVGPGGLKWPKKLDELRTAHARAFHYEAFRMLIALKSKIETTHGGYSSTVWGIVSNSVKTKKASSRKWDARTCKLHSASTKGWFGRHYYEEIFIGHQFCDHGSGTRPPRWHKSIIAGHGIPKKLFGTDTSDQLNPQLGISPKMLDNAKWRKDHKWVLNK